LTKSKGDVIFMKKVLVVMLAVALLVGGAAMVNQKSMKSVAFDPGTGGHSIIQAAAYDPGTGGH
jgi:hypothetical protein